MTVGSALQSAAIRLVGRKPTSFFSSSDTLALELTDLVNEVARDIVDAHDWRSLTLLAALSGDGTAEAHDLPTDYQRMPKKAKVWSSSWPGLFYEAARDLDDWYDIKAFSSSGAPGWWILLQGKMNIWPVVPSGTQAQFYYITKDHAQNETGTSQDTFSADTDEFKLSERLLTLGLVWRWRAQKRLEYAEDLKNYELALSRDIADDKGSRVLVEGVQRWPAGVNTPWPGVISV